MRDIEIIDSELRWWRHFAARLASGVVRCRR
jgi:hypothetical protein